MSDTENIKPTPLLTVLNYSAGKQSSCLLWMVLRGEIPTPPNFIVLRANPGMENTYSNLHAIGMRRRCEKAGIYYEDVKGPNLYRDIVTLTVRGASRLDNPPYWTKNVETGKRGRLMQKCTAYYKIAPMDRVIRRLLEERFQLSHKSKRIPVAAVEKWIGFASDEIGRCKNPNQAYVVFRYPLIEMKMSTADVGRYYQERGLEVPPRSVCNACFANGLDTYREMYHNRPLDWHRAVEVDRASRNWSQLHIRDEVYVHQSLMPLEDFPKYDFDPVKIRVATERMKLDNQTLHITPSGTAADDDDWSCDSGYCLT